jgi:hypothetical protein
LPARLQRYLGADMLLDLLPVLVEPEKTVREYLVKFRVSN